MCLYTVVKVRNNGIESGKVWINPVICKMWTSFVQTVEFNESDIRDGVKYVLAEITKKEI